MANNRSLFWGALILDSVQSILNDSSDVNSNHLNGTHYEVLFYLISRSEGTTNIAHTQQSKISSDLNRNKSTVSKAIKALISKQYIVKIKDEHAFMLNPNLFYVGLGKPHDRIPIREKFNNILSDNGIAEPRFEFDEDNKTFIDNSIDDDPYK